MATYVNDLRLKEIATGDESGTWGTSTNTNLELIAEAFSFGTEAITTNADTHTTTIADGSTDPGRSIYLKYTGTLDSACTITIGPNTVSKLWFIENGTSGSQNIIISQGSGANVTVPAGEVKAIYSDGAGSGAAMVDAFAGLKVSDAAQTNITSLGTLTTLTVDDITIDGSTISDSGDLTLDIGGDIILDADGGNVTFKDGGTAIGDLVNSSSDFVIESKVQDKDIIFKGDDGGSGITALTLDMSDAGKALFNKGGTFNELVTIDGGSTANTVLALDSSTANTFLKITDSNTNEGNFIGCTTDDLTFFTRNTERVRIDSTGHVLVGKTSGTSGNKIETDGRVSAGAGSTGQPTFNCEGDTNTGINLPESDRIQLITGGTERIRIDSSGRVSIGTTTTDRELKVQKSGDNAVIAIVSGTSNLAGIVMGDTDDDDIGHILYNNSSNSMSFRTNTSDAVTIASDGKVGIGDTSPIAKLTVKAASDTIRAESLATDAKNITMSYHDSDDRGQIISTQDGFADKDLLLRGANLLFQRSGGTEAMRIDSSGNLLIGTASFNAGAFGSAQGINVSGTQPMVLVHESDTDKDGYIGIAGSVMFVHTADAIPMRFGTSDTERMRIHAGGGLSVGTTTQRTFFDVQGTTTSDVMTVLNGSTANANVGMIIFRDGAADFCGQITSNGSTNTTAYNTSSDARLKNVLGEAKGLEVINQLNPVHFEWKKSGVKQDGLIAQEVEPIVPNAITYNKESDVYSMDYSKLVTPLIKAIQEQQEQIEALQSEINNLKAK